MVFFIVIHRELGSDVYYAKKRKVIAYVLQQLNIYEKNYPTYDLELVVVVYGLKIWLHFLYDVHVDVFSGHKSLHSKRY